MSRSALATSVRQLRSRLVAQRAADDSDEQLLRAFLANRDDNAFSVLVRRYGPMVLRLCRRVLGHEQDAEDAFQATFLVLAQSAAALRKQTALASFLHGTAYRTALKAIQAAERRRKHEGQAPTRSSVDPADELSWREVRTLVDDEIARLPEKYRSAFILCCLESVGQAEAARRLGLKEGTLSSRLTMARKVLSQRLTRRGVELTAVLAASTLATQAAPALSPPLVASTIKAALGEGTAGLVSASVAELAKSVAAATVLNKMKMAAIALLVVTMLGGAGLWFRAMPQAALVPLRELPAAKADDKSRTAPSQPEAAKTMEIQGRVFGPDGSPKAGAKILLLSLLDPGEQQELLPNSGKVRQLGVSAADGRFTAAVPKDRRQHHLVAQCAGNGIDFVDLDSLKSGKSIELRLVKDHAIRGRIVNTEGKPVAGVQVAVNQLNTFPHNSLDSFLVFFKNRPFNHGLRGDVKHIWSGAGAVLAATTDADGRFVLNGVGEERLVSLRLSGGSIAADEVWVVNRPGFDPKPYNQATLDNLPKGERGFNGRWMLSGPDVSFFAEAEKIIRGVVTEADTGKGRPGVLVQLTRKNGADDTGGDFIPLKLQAMTDAQGRYEIHGAHKAKSYLVEVGSDVETGYLGRAVWAEDTPGYRPATADIRVRKGVIVTGRMIDKATGKPLNGSISIADLSDNPYVKEYSFGSFHSIFLWCLDFRSTDANGVFRAVTIPGPVLLMGGPGRERFTYKSYIPDPKYPRYFEKDGNVYRYSGSGFTIVQGIFCKVLQIEPGAAVVEQDIVLERHSVRGVVKIQDAEGRPLTEAEASYATALVDGDSCTLYGEATDPPRLLVFYEANRSLAGTLRLKSGEKLPPVVTLRPMGSVKGRLLDKDGKPVAGIVVAPRYSERAASGIVDRIYEGNPIASDANGYFMLDSLVPELPFELSFRRGPRDLVRETKSAEATIQVKPGQCRDVGDVRVKAK